ncbi:hypothetical protein [Streptomyces sp. yara]|uniref:hypothetical protein n=1 Tax=Streptomyces sp. yara TaxID=3458421 RepID=UPI00403FF48D
MDQDHITRPWAGWDGRDDIGPTRLGAGRDDINPTRLGRIGAGRISPTRIGAVTDQL